MATVETGIERVQRDEIGVLHGKRIGIIANPTAIDRQYRHIVDILCDQSDVDVRILFGPEHGIRGAAQDMIAVATDRDARTGLPVVSLYGSDEASLSPSKEHLADLDALVFDIQDVGSRYYTYVWTMVLAMRVCADAGVEMIVLDRPNPIGGAVEGGAILAGFESFVGLKSLPNRHGMTAGEIARWAKQDEGLDVELSVVKLRGWSRSMYFDQTGLPWVMPSPNMPTLDTALVYPGMCLVEGTALSEGRGVTRPFEIAGAPFIDGDALAENLASMNLPGARFRPLSFLPTFQKHAGTVCGGVQIHVEDRDKFLPYRTGVAFLAAIARLWPQQFSWRTRAYEFVDTIPAIDLLAGSDVLRTQIEAGASLDEMAEQWCHDEEEFRRMRTDWLLYE